jgi:c-di-GMP-binding flagellar brake protein YcgR
MNEQFSGAEKRQFKRLRASFIVIYRPRKPSDIFMFIDDTAVTGIMLDLSEDGISLSTDYDLPAATVLSIEFTLINPYAARDKKVRKIEATGEVCSSTLFDQEEQRVGIHFTRIDPDDKRALADFVKTAAR